MKNIIVVILIFAALVSCDKIKTPNQRPPAVYNCIDTSIQIVNTNSVGIGLRKVLLEEYTGHTCFNCPPAAVELESILAAHPSQVVAITNHVSKNFAAPKGDSIYKEDFRNPTSDKWDLSTNFGVSGNGLPKGMVNRQQPWLQPFSAWSGLVAANISLAQSAQMEMTSYYDPNKYYITVKIKTTFKKPWNGINLMVLLTQDSIISDQTESPPLAGTTTDLKDPQRRLGYVFNHIVVGSVNDPQGGSGQLVKKGPIAVGDSVTLVNSCFLVNKCFYPNSAFPKNKNVSSVCLNDMNINVVAFVYDIVTQEVLQAEQIKIHPRPSK